jgi:hypothetical protein
VRYTLSLLLCLALPCAGYACSSSSSSPAGPSNDGGLADTGTDDSSADTGGGAQDAGADTGSVDDSGGILPDGSHLIRMAGHWARCSFNYRATFTTPAGYPDRTIVGAKGSVDVLANTDGTVTMTPTVTQAPACQLLMTLDGTQNAAQVVSAQTCEDPDLILTFAAAGIVNNLDNTGGNLTLSTVPTFDGTVTGDGGATVTANGSAHYGFNCLR